MPSAKCGFDDGPAGEKGCDALVVFGPTLIVHIGFDPAYKFVPGQIVATPPITGTPNPVHALVDTGATESCIDAGLAMQLNLPIVDRRSVGGIGGAHEVNMHLAQIHVPSLAFTIHGAFAGVNLIAGGQPHRALIGRTFLQHFTMVYEGLTGTVTLTRD